MNDVIAFVYYTLIKARPQRRTFESVPDHLKKEVESMLSANGYDLNGDSIKP